MTVRGDWLSVMADHCRRIHALSRKIASTHLIDAICQALERLPAPDNSVERIVQRGLLFDAAMQFGHDAHVGFHQEYPSGQESIRACGFAVSSSLDGWPEDPTASPADAFRSWIHRYTGAFRAAHPLTRVLAAEEYIRLNFRTRATPTYVARRVGCSVSHFQRSFKEVTGQTVRQYQDNLRLQEALRQLHETDVKIEAVAADVGYCSKKDLYRVLRSQLGCTPLEFRTRSQRIRSDVA